MERKKRDLMKFLRKEGISPARAYKLLFPTLSAEDKHFLYRLKDPSCRKSILSELRGSLGKLLKS